MKRMMMVAAALLIAGCASAPQKIAVREVNVCSGDECDTSGHKYNAEQLLAGFHQLLKANEGQKVTVCDSDPKTRACESVGVCHLVIGGFSPGNGCVESIVFS